jgi:hypothetical protein
MATVPYKAGGEIYGAGVTSYTFEITFDTSAWTQHGSYHGAVNDLKIESYGNLKDPSGEFTNANQLLAQNRPQTIRTAVSWFKGEDLGLLHKVLDDPQSFNIRSIKPGAFVVDVVVGGVSGQNACIVGALAIAKAPQGERRGNIEVLASAITNNGTQGSMALGVLDQIITGGYLDEFKAEIQRQMLER